MSTPATSSFFWISHNNSLLGNLVASGLYMGVALLGNHIVSKQLYFLTNRLTRKIIALALFDAWMTLPLASLAIVTKNPAYAGLAVLSLGHVFWAAHQIYTTYYEEWSTQHPQIQEGIKKAMRVMTILLLMPTIIYSWQAYSSLATKV